MAICPVDHKHCGVDLCLEGGCLLHDVPTDDELVASSDPSVLTDEDRAAIDGLGDDLIDRLIERSTS